MTRPTRRSWLAASDPVLAWSAWHPRRLLALLALITAVLGLGLFRLDVDIAPDAVIIDGSQEDVDNDRFRREFGSAETALIVTRVDDPFDAAALSKLIELHDRLEAVPHAASVYSLAGFPGTPGGLIDRNDPTVDDPTSILEIGLIERFVGQYPDGSGYLTALVQLSATKDGASDRVEAPFLDGPDITAYVNGVLDAIDEVRTDSFDPAVASSFVYGIRTSAMVSDWIAVGSISLFALLTITLWAIHRSIRVAALPLVVVALTVVWTLGLMGWAGQQLNALSQLLIMLLFVAGVADTVHLLERHRQLLATGGRGRDVAIAAVADRRSPIVFTSITTAIGFASFAASGLGLIEGVGLFGAIGVLFAMAISLVAGPAVLPMLSPSTHPIPWLDALGPRLGRIGLWATRHSTAVLAVTTLALVGAGIAATGVTARLDITRWTPSDNGPSSDLAAVEETIGGGLSIRVVVDTGVPDSVAAPQFFDRLTAIRDRFTTARFAGVSPSVDGDIELIRESVRPFINCASVPEEPSCPTLAQIELWTPADLVNDDRSASTIALRLPVLDPITGEGVDQLAVAREVDELARVITAEQTDGTRVFIAGTTVAGSLSLDRALPEVVKSFGIALLLIGLVIIVVLRSVRRGLVAMIPNLVPAILVLGLMGVAGIPLDLLTIVVGGIVIGISVDDTVHITDSLFLAPDRTGDLERDVERTMRTAGPAIVITSVLIGVGLLSLVAFPLPLLREIGALGATAIALALVADLVVLPAVLTALESGRPTEGTGPSRPMSSPRSMAHNG